jgi:hypothetical protein
VKWLKELELIFGPIFIANLARSHTSINSCFRAVPNPVPKAGNFSITMWCWSS